MQEVLAFLPSTITDKVLSLPQDLIDRIEEIRVRTSRVLEVTARGKPYFLPYTVTEEDSEQLINKLSHHSFYTLEEELKRGYITIEGGHRVGLAGKVILEGGVVKGIRNLASFNIRIAREKLGIAQSIFPYVYHDGWKHTMLIGSPQTGKTTLLRDLARMISTGIPERNIPPFKVGIVDERSEIAGCVNGIPQLMFGPRVDVLDACPKAEGMMMLIRSMSPDVLVVDEIGRVEDGQAIQEAVNAGITLIMTTHGSSLSEVRKRPVIKDIVNLQTIERFVELRRGDEPGKVHEVWDEHGQSLLKKVSVT
ncbi:stage III sporulation protein AA [Rossellomorea vietnamensis]|uniref:Stage III sporulation protein AA n=1 Tax=Rossellomorea vietnamensis TaxID=218284 RepID=A0A0P6WQ43_9BACI|nr:stage III sporulation protein AA [Rossellomorea vietnamensis]KPL59631.1 stage III sporulation protein AA [Rossellomorea vietnamensis]